MTGFRDWNFTAGSDDLLGRRLRDGYDIGAATAVSDPAAMSTFDRVALERDEQFNTRILISATARKVDRAEPASMR
jgi:hypothetical protein